jgi:hypothetical protein
MHDRRRAQFVGRTYEISVEDYKHVEAVIGQALQLLGQLKFSGERAARQEIV